jgi:peptide/nickel transport system substrate-binding protein
MKTPDFLRQQPRQATRTLRAITVASVLGVACLGANAQAEKPQYGGTLNIGMVYLTLSPLSWDPADWTWKYNQDTGLTTETLFSADLSKSVGRGGKHAFVADSWLPTDAIRGELAESWKMSTDKPLRVDINLRKGVMFPDKPGVMKSRELVAEDVVYSYNRLDKSPKKIPTYFDHIDKVEVTGKHSLRFTFKHYFSEWDYRFGWGYYSAIVPKEVSDAGAGNWKNLNGTGPFMLTDYVQGNAVTFSKNDIYWDKEKIAGQSYKLPFVDKIVYRTIKDEASFLTALRTAKLDVLESVRWSAVPELKRNAPALKWKRWVDTGGTFVAMRVDTKPFDDIRVRQALNMAVNKKEIVSAYYGGNAVLFGYPMHPDYTGYYEPLEQMPVAVQELFAYNPEKAKALLAEAGYPKGFTFKTQVCACSPDHMDLAPLVAAYLARVGVTMEIQPMEYGAFLSAMTTKTNAAGYMMRNGHTNPTTSIRKSFVTKQTWNPSQYSDPEFDKRMNEAYQEPDEDKRKLLIKLMTRDIVEKAPYIWLPTPVTYTAWWPWVKNYDGELRAGSERPGPIHARMWVDEAMKKKLGF